jgi:microbial collagenase
MPHQRQSLPPTAEQSQFKLPATTKPRYDLLPKEQRSRLKAQLATPECKDMNKLASYSGGAGRLSGQPAGL